MFDCSSNVPPLRPFKSIGVTCWVVLFTLPASISAYDLLFEGDVAPLLSEYISGYGLQFGAFHNEIGFK